MMTPVYVLHEGFYYRKESSSEVLSVHLTFDSAYRTLMEKSKHMSAIDDYDPYEMKEIKKEKEIEAGIFIKGFIERDKFHEMNTEYYTSWAIDVFVRDTKQGTYSRVMVIGEQENHYVITAKYLQQ